MIAKFFLFILVLGFVAVLLVMAVVFSFYRKLQRKAREFSKQMNGGYASGSDRQRSEKGETIIDRRSQGETNRKIFTKDEGEYVDFKEEK